MNAADDRDRPYIIINIITVNCYKIHNNIICILWLSGLQVGGKVVRTGYAEIALYKGMYLCTYIPRLQKSYQHDITLYETNPS